MISFLQRLGSLYPSFRLPSDRDQFSKLARVWREEFEGYTFSELEAALKAYMLEEKYAPSVGGLLKKITKPRAAQERSADPHFNKLYDEMMKRRGMVKVTERCETSGRTFYTYQRKAKQQTSGVRVVDANELIAQLGREKSL